MTAKTLERHIKDIQLLMSLHTLEIITTYMTMQWVLDHIRQRVMREYTVMSENFTEHFRTISQPIGLTSEGDQRSVITGPAGNTALIITPVPEKKTSYTASRRTNDQPRSPRACYHSHRRDYLSPPSDDRRFVDKLLFSRFTRTPKPCSIQQPRAIGKLLGAEKKGHSFTPALSPLASQCDAELKDKSVLAEDPQLCLYS